MDSLTIGSRKITGLVDLREGWMVGYDEFDQEFKIYKRDLINQLKQLLLAENLNLKDSSKVIKQSSRSATEDLLGDIFAIALPGAEIIKNKKVPGLISEKSEKQLDMDLLVIYKNVKNYIETGSWKWHSCEERLANDVSRTNWAVKTGSNFCSFITHTNIKGAVDYHNSSKHFNPKHGKYHYFKPEFDFNLNGHHYNFKVDCYSTDQDSPIDFAKFVYVSIKRMGFEEEAEKFRNTLTLEKLNSLVDSTVGFKEKYKAQFKRTNTSFVSMDGIIVKFPLIEG